MRYLVFLMPFMLAACATSNAELAQNAFVHDDAVCTARGYDANSDDYVKCMRHLGARVGYQLGKSDGGALAFLIPPAGGISSSPVWQPSASAPPDIGRCCITK